MNASLPADARDLSQAFLHGLQAILGDKLHGVYLYGAVAFPGSGPLRDIDFHVILAATLDDRERVLLKDLHATLARDFPPPGAELDGYYILLADARRPSPPAHQLFAGIVDDSWALHCAHCRSGRCIVLHGPDPLQLYPAIQWPTLAQALDGELNYVAQHLTDYPDYCVLNLCRVMYSFAARDVVVSKRTAARWALTTIPQWRALIEAAVSSYDHAATPAQTEQLANETGAFFTFASQRIEEFRATGANKPS
jgi:hypothetical protein